MDEAELAVTEYRLWRQRVMEGASHATKATRQRTAHQEQARLRQPDQAEGDTTAGATGAQVYFVHVFGRDDGEG